MSYDLKHTLECKYCGHMWEVSAYEMVYGSGGSKCPICQDTNIKSIKKAEKIDYYKGKEVK